jgi:cytochrome c oxidase cbb3-type subunit 3
VLLRLISCVVVAALGVQAEQAKKPNPAPLPASQGEQIFTFRCASCHGLDGRGSRRAPDLVSTEQVQHASEADLSRIIKNGIVGTGMPAFRSLATSEVQTVVRHLRTLQGKAARAALPGNPNTGRTLFFGSAGCSGCHLMNGEGGFLASDLSSYGRSHTVDDIRTAITSPDPGQDPRARAVTAITRDGQKYSGIIRNEDNFSLQLQSFDGEFHFLPKSDLQNLERESQPIMPSNYGSRLSRQELDDLVSYIAISQRGHSRVASTKEHEP